MWNEGEKERSFTLRVLYEIFFARIWCVSGVCLNISSEYFNTAETRHRLPTRYRTYAHDTTYSRRYRVNGERNKTENYAAFQIRRGENKTTKDTDINNVCTTVYLFGLTRTCVLFLTRCRVPPPLRIMAPLSCIRNSQYMRKLVDQGIILRLLVRLRKPPER